MWVIQRGDCRGAWSKGWGNSNGRKRTSESTLILVSHARCVGVVVALMNLWKKKYPFVTSTMSGWAEESHSKCLDTIYITSLILVFFCKNLIITSYNSWLHAFLMYCLKEPTMHSPWLVSRKRMSFAIWSIILLLHKKNMCWWWVFSLLFLNAWR